MIVRTGPGAKTRGLTHGEPCAESRVVAEGIANWSIRPVVIGVVEELPFHSGGRPIHLESHCNAGDEWRSRITVLNHSIAYFPECLPLLLCVERRDEMLFPTNLCPVRAVGVSHVSR